MKTIAIINQKGGVGKTACAYNLAYNLSMKNLTTCLIDLDPSANATKGFNFTNNNKGTSSYDLLLRRGNLNYHAQQVFEENTHLFLVPSTIKLAMAQRELNTKPFRETILDKKIDSILTNGYVLIDCSPTLSDLTINAIYAANFILIPVTYEDDALEGLSDLFNVINEIKEKQTFSFKILRNQKDVRKSKTNDYIEKKLEDFIANGHVFKTIIRQDEAINQAKIERKTIFQYAPNSNGAADFNALTEELINV